MNMMTTEPPRAVSHPLKSWMVAPRRIGKRTYRGHCVVAEAMHVTYQQQSTTFGRSAGVFGLSKDGDGFVTGGGGFVDTIHRGVVTVVFQDEEGVEQTHELPAAVASRVGSVARLDLVNGHVAAATNLTGKGRLLQLLSPADFIALPTLRKREIALGVVGLLLIANGSFEVKLLGALFAAVPAWRIWRIVEAHRHRRELGDYMAEISA